MEGCGQRTRTDVSEQASQAVEGSRESGCLMARGMGGVSEWAGNGCGPWIGGFARALELCRSILEPRDVDMAEWWEAVGRRCAGVWE